MSLRTLRSFRIHVNVDCKLKQGLAKHLEEEIAPSSQEIYVIEIGYILAQVLP